MIKSKFRNRMLASFLTIVVLPVLTLGVLGPLLYSRTISDLSATHTGSMVERVTANLDLTIRNQEKTLDMLLQNKSIDSFFLGSPEDFSSQDLSDLFFSAAISHPEITGLIAVNENDLAFSNELDRILRDPLTNEDWYTMARDNDTDFSLVTRPIGRNLRNSSGIEPDEIVSIIKSVADPDTGRFAGVLMADLSLEYLEESFDGTSRGESGDENGFFCILDGEDNFVYTPVNPIVYRINPAWFSDSTQVFEKTIQNRGYRFLFSESRYTGWKTIGVYYLEEALQPVRLVQFSALIIVLITITLTVIISMIYTSAISKPVLYLKSVMERAGHGDLTIRYDGRSRDEIDELGDGLNTMLEKIEELLQLVYREQQSKRDAELRIMQQQIRPHFLYNTLDTILWLAEENEPGQVVEMVTALTRLFRIALSEGREIISIEEEIEHVRSYLIIQKSRYEEKFEFQITCPENLHSYSVQKMILQPLVENAIYHGVKEKAGSGTIQVSIRSTDDNLELEVRDDGVGIPEDRLRIINEGFGHLDHESDRTAFALYNVNDRIRLTYGDDYGISIASREGDGTVVTIRHPLILEKD